MNPDEVGNDWDIISDEEELCNDFNMRGQGIDCSDTMTKQINNEDNKNNSQLTARRTQMSLIDGGINFQNVQGIEFTKTMTK